MTRLDAVLDPWLEDEHRDLRQSARRYMETEIAPRGDGWVSDGVPRRVFGQLAELGFVAMSVPEQQGGSGVEDPRFGAVVATEALRAGIPGLGLMLGLHSDTCVPTLLDRQRGDLQERLAAGTAITAFAELQPGGTSGSKLTGEAHAVVNGNLAEILVCWDRTSSETTIVAADAPGVEVIPVADAIGPRGCDLADITFEASPAEEAAPAIDPGVRATVALAALALAGAARAIEVTIDYTQERKAFGTPIASFENTGIVLGRLIPDLSAAEAEVGRVLTELALGTADPARATTAKRLATAAFDRAADCGMQLHGGYGYMYEYEIAHLFVASRFLRLIAGQDAELDAALSPVASDPSR